MALSDTQIRNAKPNGKVRKLSDGGGLQCWIMPTGSRIWKWAYRFNGLQRTLTIGPYPAIGLATARQKRDEGKALLVSGTDPAQQKAIAKLTKATSDATSFAEVANELLDKKRREGKAPNTLQKIEWLLSLAIPIVGKRPVAEITAPEVLALLRKIEGRGNRESARRLRGLMGEVFRYAIATSRATDDPTPALRGALASPTVKHHKAIIDPAEFGGFLRAIDGYKGQPTTLYGLKLMALVFVRTNELRHAKWSEIDLEKAVWTIPATRAKMRREHRIPLARQTIELLKELRCITGGSELLFPGIGMSGGEGRKVAPKPISENTLLGAIRRLGYGPEEMTGHGFRGTASTLLNESGEFSPDIIERALSHQEQSAIRRAYNHSEYWGERVRMAQWWADKLDDLRGATAKAAG